MRRALALLLAAAAAPAAHAAPAFLARDVPDGAVSALAAGHGRLYVAGAFTRFGPWTGGAALVDASTGALAPMPRLTGGAVAAAVPDGQGGWFLGGDFTHAGGAAHPALVHVTAAGTVDPGFAPAIERLSPDGERPAPIAALALDGDTVYVAGGFVTTGGPSRSLLAAFDARTGATLASFDAAPTGTIRALAVGSGHLLVGGTFTGIGGAPRANLAALDLTTGRVDPAFDPAGANGSVGALAVAGSRVYVGGTFTAVGNSGRGRLAALDAASGTPDPGFLPDADQEVTAIAPVADRVYVAGVFQRIGGRSRPGLAAVDAATGRPLAGFVPPRPSGVYRAVAVTAGGILAGGVYQSLGDVDRTNLALLSPSTGAVLDGPIQDAPGASVGVLAEQGADVLVGGGFYQLTGWPATGIAALRLAGGGLDPAFRVPAGTSAGQLVLVGGVLYIAGGGLNYPGRLEAFFAATGVPLPSFRPHPNISRIAVGCGRIYAVTLDRDGRLRDVVALDRFGRRRRGFRVHVTATEPVAIADVAVRGCRVYVGGSFTAIDGVARPDLAAVDGRTGRVVRGFRPPPDVRAVTALAVGPAGLYVGGRFVAAGGARRLHLAAFDPRTGRLRRAFRPRGMPQATVPTEIVSGRALDVAAGDRVVRLAPRSGALVAAVRINHETISPEVDAVAEIPGGLAIGGAFGHDAFGSDGDNPLAPPNLAFVGG